MLCFVNFLSQYYESDSESFTDFNEVLIARVDIPFLLFITPKFLQDAKRDSDGASEAVSHIRLLLTHPS